MGGHHKGKEPDPLPCPVRSIHMSQICSDQWDASWIDSFEKKTIFEIILAANHMDIKSLVHLGSAKIATLIKQLDQTEISRIIEEEEQYRREQAQLQHGDEVEDGGAEDDDAEDEQLQYSNGDEDENSAEEKTEDWNEHGNGDKDENGGTEEDNDDDFDEDAWHG